VISRPGHWLRRRIASPSSPTAELYFANACADIIPQIKGAVWLAPTVFASEKAIVVFRHDANAVISPNDPRSLIYVLDDAIHAGRTDPSLPLWYRLRLRLLECEAAARLLPRASQVVVSGGGVETDLPSRLFPPGLPLTVLSPFWRHAFSDLSHFDNPRPFRVGYLASQVHARNATTVFTIMRQVLAGCDDVRFAIPDNHTVPRDLIATGRIDQIPAGPWGDYQGTLISQQIHLALYPTGTGAFDRARSANKLIEHAVLGAGGLYSTEWADRLGMIDGVCGRVLPDDPDQWARVVLECAFSPAIARALAAGGQALAHKHNDPAEQVRFWRRMLLPG